MASPHFRMAERACPAAANPQPPRFCQRLIGMARYAAVVAVVAVALAVTVRAQEPDARQIARERKDAEAEAPKLVDVLALKPGMTVADVGAGGGAMTVVLGTWIGSGRVFATDVTQDALRATREYIAKEGLTNVTVIEGAQAATNLPDACCDAVFLRNVFHHVTDPVPFNKSLYASLKPGGRLAIIDFPPGKGSKLFPGVPANRGGHGIPVPVVVDEMQAAGFTHVRTIDNWPDGDTKINVFLALFRR
jgi:SAM-dependent methyltransferase